VSGDLVILCLGVLATMLVIRALTRLLQRLLLVVAPAWFWFSGHCMDGEHRTNATWTRRGDRALHPSALAWHYLPRLHRAGYRTGGTTLTLAIAYGLVTAFFVTVVSLCCAAAALATLSVWHTVWKIRRWQHERHYVRPLEGTLLRGIPVRPAMLEVERVRDVIKGDVIKGVAIEWPHDTEITPADQGYVLQAVTMRLALEAPEAAWQLKGRMRSVTFTPSEPPPLRVTWEDVAAAVKAAAADELVLGLGKKEAVIKASYGESPHAAIPGGSGGGKSNLAAFMLLQEMMRGSLIFNLDPKWISHLWLQGLPNVINAHDIPDLHLALTWLGRELLRRTRAAYYSAEGTGRVRGNVGSRIIVLCEELNYGMQGLKDYWTEARDKDDPKRSPALTGLAALSAAGRASDMHEWLIAQMLTAESTGVRDSSVRTNCGIKLMARHDKPGWDMVVGKHVPMPPQTTIPGRIQVVTGEGVRETQVPYLHLDDKDTGVSDKAVAWARELAVSGTVARIPADIPQQLWPPCVAALAGSSHMSPELGDGAVVVRQEPPQPPAKTLREAVGEGVFGHRSLAAVRKAVERAADPPKPVGKRDGAHTYLLTDLHTFAKGLR
jgi:molybdopterin-binding protein